MTLSPGTQLGHYEISTPLGAGGMGEVYLAHDTSLRRRPVAIKLLPAEFSRNEERLRRFEQEAYAVAKLNHPSIAHIYEIGESEGLHFIAMEYVEGETLREKIHVERVPLPKLIKYLTQVADGLAKAHSAGIVHRDLKPDNVMIARDGYAKILDFGLAKLVEPQKLSAAGNEAGEAATALMPQLSTPGVVMGTVGYMSPEQAQGRVNEIDQRSDIFSFGCILYEAATGRRAFEGKDMLDSLHRIVHAPTPQIKDSNPLAPEELQRIVRRCLAKDPERRYQSIKEVAIELEELLEQLKGGAEPEHSVAPSATGAASTVTQATAGGAGATGIEAARSTTSAEYLVGGIERHKKGVFIALAMLLVAAAGLAYGLYHLFSHRASGLQSIKIVRLTNNGKVSETASISPDGKYVAYVAADDAGQSSIWVRHVATTSNVQIVLPAGADVGFGAPVFSPDGNYVYYLRRERSGPGALYQVPVLGGTSKKLLDVVNNPVSFSPDGRHFAFVRRYTDLSEDAVVLANTDGTGEQKLATLKHPDYFIGGLAWSPDGKTIACPMGGFTGGYYRSYVVIQVADGTQQPLTPHRWSNVERVAGLSDGSGVLVPVQEQAAA
ncbi:MAG: eukaryotic-like serine/threonine-protein kinase, partial [Acidobacteriota bacterium]|nr:eukaryotic-like serine/threonine-protein kinase [Acidobacteriota bacterium]